MTIQESAQQTAALGVAITQDNTSLYGVRYHMSYSWKLFAHVSQSLSEMSDAFTSLGSTSQAEKCIKAAEEAEIVEALLEVARDHVDETMDQINAIMQRLENLVAHINALDTGAMG